MRDAASMHSGTFATSVGASSTAGASGATAIGYLSAATAARA